MDNITLHIPQPLENMNLPNPELLTYYSDLEKRIIWLEEEVTECTLEFVRKIIEWNREDEMNGLEPKDRKPIKIFFFSPGGMLDIQSTLSNIISISKTPIYGYNMGITASAAAYIYLSCHKRFMLKDSYFLFHKGSIEVHGNATDVLTLIEDYQSQLQFLVEKIIDRTLYTLEEVEQNIVQDWYVRSEEALEKGICHEIVNNISELF